MLRSLVLLVLAASSANTFTLHSPLPQSTTPSTRLLASSFRDNEKTTPMTMTMTMTATTTQWSMLEKVPVQTLDKRTVDLGDVVQGDGDGAVILSCLSHFGDFNAWELTQQYLSAIDSGRIGTERYA
jgi:hypothetical protein